LILSNTIKKLIRESGQREKLYPNFTLGMLPLLFSTGKHLWTLGYFLGMNGKRRAFCAMIAALHVADGR
jgi:hypothetical protein